MNRSESIVKLAKALVKMQSEMEGAAKSSENPFFKSKYADLESCWKAVKEPLTNNGLAVTQLVGEYIDGIQSLETILMHESGEFISGVASIPVGKKDAHGMGSACSYLRRYGMCAVLGLIQQDDDGNLALDPKKVVKKNKQHLPNTGALDDLPLQDKEKAKEVAMVMVEAHKEGDVEKARAVFYDATLTNELRCGIWELLQPNSKVRSAVKDLQNNRKTN